MHARRVMAPLIAAALLPVAASGAQSSPPTSRVLARVTGTVFDSIAMRPLPGAFVQLVVATDPSRSRSARTDAAGTFRVDSLAPGTYLLGFLHPRLDTLGLESPLFRVDVRDSGEVRVPLATPSGRTLLGRLCGTRARDDSSGVFRGAVRSTDADARPSPGRLRVQWAELAVTGRKIEQRAPSLLAETNATGDFTICGVPTSARLMVRAWTGSDSSGVVELEVPADGFLQRDLFVGRAQRVAVRAPDDSAAAAPALVDPSSRFSVLRGEGRLRGAVRGPTGAPVPGARVTVWGTGLETRSSANGLFSLDSLPAGTHTLEARAIGFQRLQLPIDIPARQERSIDVALEPMGAVIDTVRVRASRPETERGMVDFSRRRQQGVGHFLDDDDIERRGATSIADLLRFVPGVIVLPGQTFGDLVLMRGSGLQQYCAPTLWVDGMRIANDGGNLEGVAHPRFVRGIEVYARVSNLPAEFQTLDGCGAIVIWTGMPRVRPGR